MNAASIESIAGPKGPFAPADKGGMSTLPYDMPVVLATAAAGPLSPEHVRELAESRKRSRKIRRAASVASFDGWTTALFGAVALLGGVWSLPALLLGVALVGAAVNGLVARRGLLRFETKAASRLGAGQIVVALAVAAYCAWNIVAGLSGQGGAGPAPTGDPNVDSLLSNVTEMARGISVIVYGAVIVVTGLVQGFGCWYYFSRRPLIEAYRRDTPAWIVSLHSRGALS